MKVKIFPLKNKTNIAYSCHFRVDISDNSLKSFNNISINKFQKNHKVKLKLYIT